MKADTLRPELKTKIEDWILSFYHLDPRYKILTFFNQCAREGADNLTDDSQDETNNTNRGSSNGPIPCTSAGIGSSNKNNKNNDSINTIEHQRNTNLMMNQSGRSSARNMKHIRPSTIALLKNVFNATSILTVWRPCSNDAMRKMMEGAGVGKGLDIKGKSSKRGILSAFVPFMQIFKEEHKLDIQPISANANMRIYYKHEKLRDYVYNILEDFLINGPKRKKKPKLNKKKKSSRKNSMNGTNKKNKMTITAEEKKKIHEHEVPEIVSIIEANNNLRISQKKGLEDAAAELFCQDEENDASEGGPAAATDTANSATANAATDAAHSTYKNLPDDEEIEEDAADAECGACDGVCLTIRQSTNGEEKVEAVVIAAEKAAAAAAIAIAAEEAAAYGACGGGCLTMSSLQTEPGAIRESTNGEEKVEAVVIAAEKAAAIASAAAIAIAAEEAAAYENPYSADDDDVPTDDEVDLVDHDDLADISEDDDEDGTTDSDNEVEVEDEEDGIYVGTFDHLDKNSPTYTPSKPLKKIKKFVKTGYYGIECSQRLFWYATIADASIERKGTGTETGRPSLPGFQDANMKTLKVAQSQIPKPSPMPVVLQHQSYEDCMNKKKSSSSDDGDESSDDDDSSCNPLDVCLDPIYLVMAYEEQGSIKPVVSDFDGFLLGWRREALWFGCNLPRDQEKLMMWCVDHVEEVLEEQKRNPTNGDTWTIRWLDILKKEAARGFQIEMPEYGFGDPKSTSIMEHAANKLKSTGAVRHGSECFNYQFPQEIDEMFLLISDTLKPVPWKYVKVEELQEILLERIKESFVFPLNPKWILCDPGWKKVYDELIASRTLYATMSTDVWFPAHTKVRDRIEEIYKNHPEGFQRCTDPAKARPGGDSSTNITDRRNLERSFTHLRGTLDEGLGDALTGNAAADLAQLELDDFVVRSSKAIGDGKNFAHSMKTARASISIKDLEDDRYNCALKDSNTSSSMKYSSNSSELTASSSMSTSFNNNTRSSSRPKKRGSGVSHTSSLCNSSVESSGTSGHSNTSHSNTTTNTQNSRSVFGSGSSKTPTRGIRKFMAAKSKKLFGRNRGNSCNSTGSAHSADIYSSIQPPDLARSVTDQANDVVHGGTSNASTSSSLNTSDEIRRNFSGSLLNRKNRRHSPKR